MMFLAQTVATIVASFVVIGVQDWMFGNIEGLCSINQSGILIIFLFFFFYSSFFLIDAFTCPKVRVFATASLIWGGIGPARVFNKGAL